MSYEMVNVNPEDVRFSQDSIADCFTGNLRNMSLYMTSVRIKQGTLDPSDFPPIELYKDENGVMWSKDNRRLWVFRRAGLKNITAKLYSHPPGSRVPPPENQRALMSQASFYPRIRQRRF